MMGTCDLSYTLAQTHRIYNIKLEPECELRIWGDYDTSVGSSTVTNVPPLCGNVDREGRYAGVGAGGRAQMGNLCTIRSV